MQGKPRQQELAIHKVAAPPAQLAEADRSRSRRRSTAPGIDITGLSGFYRCPSIHQSGRGVSPVASPLFVCFDDSTTSSCPVSPSFPFPFFSPSSPHPFPRPTTSHNKTFYSSTHLHSTMSAPAAFSDIAKAANDVCLPFGSFL